MFSVVLVEPNCAMVVRRWTVVLLWITSKSLTLEEVDWESASRLLDVALPRIR